MLFSHTTGIRIIFLNRKASPETPTLRLPRIKHCSIRNFSLTQQCNINAHGWTQFSVNVTTSLNAYKGQTIQVYFQGTTDYTLPTDFYVDDVALSIA